MRFGECSVELTGHLLGFGGGDGGERPDDVVAGTPHRPALHRRVGQMTKPPGGAVAYHSIPDGFRNNQACSWPTLTGDVRGAVVGVHYEDVTPRAHPIFYRFPEVVAPGELVRPR